MLAANMHSRHVLSVTFVSKPVPCDDDDDYYYYIIVGSRDPEG